MTLLHLARKGAAPMGNLRLGALALSLLGLALVPQFARADSPATRAVDRDVLACADKIDQLIAAKWAAHGAEPTRTADDAEFLRRVSLDLTGRIPTVADVRAFLDDTSSDKRLRQVRRMLEHPRYA